MKGKGFVSMRMRLISSIVTNNNYEVGKTGNFLVWALASAVITAIGAGLMSTLSVQASVAKWVMFQFVAGLGRGCGMQTVSTKNHYRSERAASSLI